MRRLSFLFVFALAGPASAQPHYTFVEIAPLHVARDVNDHGVVVGFQNPLLDPPNGFSWTRTGGLQPLQLGDASMAESYLDLRVNVAGAIVGTFCPADCAGRPQPAILRNGTVTFLGNVPDGSQITAFGINRSGVVVGESFGINRSVMPFIFVPGLGLQLLPGFSGVGRALDVNDWGLVVGSGLFLPGDTDINNDAWIWIGGTTRMLPKLLRNHSYEAHAVNNYGQVAGPFFGPIGSGVFLWSAATGTVDLHAPGSASRVVMNDRGHIVATVTAAGGNQPFLYKNGTWTNINDLVPGGTPIHLDTVYAINNKGWMVGFGRSGPSGEARAFVLIPPTVDLRANGQDQPVTLRPGDALHVDLSFDASAGGSIPNGDLYIGVATDAAVLWFGSGGPSLSPSPIFSGVLSAFGPQTILNLADVSALAPGKYKFFAVVDRTSNGIVDGDFIDSVEVVVTPP